MLERLLQQDPVRRATLRWQAWIRTVPRRRLLLPCVYFVYVELLRVAQLPFQRQDSSACATLTTRPNAAISLAIAILDTNRVPERISVAVRSLHLSRTGPSHSIFFSFPAQGQKCWRDSYNKTQCGEPPCDGIPGYEPCPGEDFCCRASTLVKLSWYELLNFLLFQRRDSSAGVTLTIRPSAVINLAIASLDMSRAPEKISVAVRLLCLR